MTDTPHVITCPNCGSQAMGNFCAECGQPTHLHKDSFLGLIHHFFEHYFHYDSKFFRTMNLLWFRPGALTLAYWNKQRMKYIAPVSLYIFISAVYFLVSSSMLPYNTSSARNFVNNVTTTVKTNTTPDKQAAQTSAEKDKLKWLFNNPEALTAFEEKLMHFSSKLIFCMIPIMGLLLKLFFIRRKELFFVDHVIFSLHIHSLYFSVMTFRELIPDVMYKTLIGLALTLLVIMYVVAALKNVYKIGTFRAIVYTFLIGFLYVDIMAIPMVWYGSSVLEAIK